MNQQLSNFVKTNTGVNDTPTLIKRDVTTEIMMSHGDIVLLGGLAETKQTESSIGFSFLPKFVGSRSGDSQATDILVLLNLRKISR